MENISMHVKIISGMCRLCLSSDGALIDMFSFSSELESQIADAVRKCTSVHVQKHSELPTTICGPCYNQLIKTQNFQMQALKSEITLKIYVQRLHDDGKQSVLGSSAIFPDIDGSCVKTNVANQDNEVNITNCEDIDPIVQYSESGCEEPEIDIVENKVFTLDSKSHTEWNSSSKDPIFNPNLIVKAEPIINDNDTEKLSDFAVTKKNIELEKEVSSDKMMPSYKCDVCNKCFNKSATLRIHQRTHTGEKPYQCNVCNKCFSNSANLSRHQRVHTREKPYQCNDCYKYFSNSGNLRIHQRVHTGEKPYQCDVCTKSFSKFDHLRTHQRIHTGEKPYRCDFCNKCFSNSDHLKRHQRIHTGEKPYKCDVCNKCFSNSSTLRIHQRVHTGEKPYQCDICNRCFSNSTTLRIHQRVHTGEKPYRCDVCNKCFSQLCALNSHKRKHSSDV